MKTSPFKICPSCEHVWPTLEEFLADPDLLLAGYQVHFDDLEAGLFLFTHTQEDCHTTLALVVKDFVSLSQRPILNKRTVQPAGCENLCMRQGAFDPCPIECECSWVREILQKIKGWPRAAA